MQYDHQNNQKAATNSIYGYAQLVKRLNRIDRKNIFQP